MPTKIQFYRLKRVYGKRKPPAINSPARSIVVTIPLRHYKDSKVQTVNHLRERTLATHLIPTGWAHVPGRNDEFFLCYVGGGTGVPKMSICLTVLEALTWTVSIFDKEAQIPVSYKWARKLDSVLL